MAEWSLLCVTLWAVLVCRRIHFHVIFAHGHCSIGSLPVLEESLSRFHYFGFCHPFNELRPTLFTVRRAGISWNFLLLLAGDVLQNPGPIQYPCTVCSRCVRSNQRALQCDCCQLWTHAACADVGRSAYTDMQLKQNFNWQCPSCLFAALPSSGVCDDSRNSSTEDLSSEPALAVDVLSESFIGTRIVHHNVQGLFSKMDELSEWFDLGRHRDIIFCFSEIWIKSDSILPDVPGFSMFMSPHHARPAGRPGSYLPGSCIFVPNTFQVEHPDVCDVIEESCVTLNICCCFVLCKHYRVAIASVYHSPSTSLKEAVAELAGVFEHLSQHAKYFILAGDFNIDLLRDSPIKSEYSHLLSDFNLSQHVIEPSRVCTHSATLIDHVVSSAALCITQSTQTIGVSDHRVQVVDFNFPVCKRNPGVMWVRSFKKCDWEQVRTDLASAPWSVMSVYDDLDDKWGFFYNILQNTLQSFAPLKRVYSRLSKRPTPWISDTILEQIKLKNKAKRVAENSGGVDELSFYKRCKNKLKAVVRQAKIDYLQSSMVRCRGCPKRAADMWSSINNVIGRPKPRKSGINNGISPDSINEFFQNVAVSPHHRSATGFMPSSVSNSANAFSFHDISPSTVLYHLSKLDVTKSTGPDGLSATFLRAVADVIVIPLTSLYNQSLRDGVVPTSWKQSSITPIHKGGSHDDPSNYRPISVVPIVAKILEKIVSNELSSYLEENHLLHPHQGAFRCGKSTSDILLLAVDRIVNLLDCGKVVCAAFLDLRKAYDSLDHCTLLQRIGELGVTNSVLRWFQNYLSDRTHRVKLGDRFSNWKQMKGGVPQGSALGPLLFLIYMNTLPLRITHGLLVQYADDTTLICSGPSVSDTADVMSSQLQLVNKWILDSKMMLNIQKSSVMWFRVSSRKKVVYPDISVDDVILRRVDKQKYLGVVFDTRLTWTHQVSNVCKKMAYYLHLINSHKYCLNSHLLKLLMESLVLSHLSYALPIWGPSLNRELCQRLDRALNRAVRICKNLSKFDHVSEHYRSLGWLPLQQLIEFRSVGMMFHQYHRSRGIPLSPPIKFGRCQLSYNTRVATQFANPERFHLSFSQRFFRCKASNWWNSISSPLIREENFHAFCKDYRDYLLAHV